jgi:murein DD-endopeptidase MepM/ murein hydrolase activator NlpD
LFTLAAVLVLVGAPDAEAKPRKKKSSHVERSKKKSKRSKEKTRVSRSKTDSSKPVMRDEDREEQPPDDFASMLDAFADAPSGLEKLDIRDPDAVAAALPSVLQWIHPIVRVEERVTEFPGREFGARRKGIDRSRGCGGGHCGIDLHAERGRPIVAVLSGILVRVERRRSGGDGMSGRHVRLRHQDGTFTTYMHMDSVVKGLEVGDEVGAGQQLGTLGSTGVSSHSAHLHFALEVPIKQDNGKGDHKKGYTRWIDPAPFLQKTRIIEKAERKHATKPNT